ncbi:MAG: hypothetical protein M3O70_03915 [Actinomycetota bacterium]|nr:hypothetical protein [Actinomycetota bacterium]
MATWRNRHHLRTGRATVRCAEVTRLAALDGSSDVAWANFSFRHWEHRSPA